MSTTTHGNPDQMSYPKQPDVRHTNRYCALLERDVRVVLVKPLNDSWQFVKCLDKEKTCAGHRCPVSEHDRHQLYTPLWT